MSTSRCGTSWANANSNCGPTCVLWSDCTANTTCFTGLDSGACLSLAVTTSTATATAKATPNAWWPKDVAFPPPGFPNGFNYPPGFAPGSPAPQGWAPGYPWPPPPPNYPWNDVAGKNATTASASGTQAVKAWNGWNGQENHNFQNSDSGTTTALAIAIGISCLALFVVATVIWIRRKNQLAQESKLNLERGIIEAAYPSIMTRDAYEERTGGGASGSAKVGELPTSEFIIAALLAAKQGNSPTFESNGVRTRTTTGSE
ncbi:hypothetical protein HDU79_002032 [Rhizoclosmatium sp. JEL0117]|nr:hypothetical protein HDU79_002032 [Rhizoclosmatium sp. JEL0117]